MIEFIRAWRLRRYIERLQRRGLRLGRNVFLNDGFFIDPAHCHLIEIGDGVVFGPSVMVFAHDASSKMVLGKTRVQRVRIGARCFIGAGAVLLPGVEIGEGSIIGAGAVLSGTVPPDEIWAGNPAQKIWTIEEYRRRMESREHLNYPDSEFAMEVLTPEKREQMVRELQDGRLGFMTP